MGLLMVSGVVPIGRHAAGAAPAAARLLIALAIGKLLTAGLPPESLSAASFGEFKPTGSNDTPDGQARNRRIEIVVVPDLSQLPGYEELANLP